MELRLAQILVRNLEDSVRDQLRRRAERHGNSVEEEVRDILRTAAAQEELASGPPLGSRISARFSNLGLASDEYLAELPKQLARSAKLE